MKTNNDSKLNAKFPAPAETGNIYLVAITAVSMYVYTDFEQWRHFGEK